MTQLGLLASLVYLVGNLFSIYIKSCFFRVFFETDASKKRKYLRALSYLCYYCINSAGFLFFNWPPKLILFSNIIGCIILSWTYLGRWKYRIYAIIAIISTSVICEDTVYHALLFLKTDYIVSIGTIATNLLYFMVVRLLQKAVDLKRGVEITFLEWSSIILIPFGSLFVSAVALDNCKDEITVAIGGMTMVFLNLLLFFLLDRIQTMYRSQLDFTLLEQQNQAYENQMKLLQSSEETIAALRHDMKNHLFALNQLAGQNKCAPIQDYLNSLAPFVEPGRKFAATGNLIVDSLLNLKLGEAAESGAEIRTDLRISKDLPVVPRDISILLGNLLDNSLRALKNCSKKEKFLSIIMEQEPGKLLLHIENTHTEILHKSGNVFKTTKVKKKGHGMGLKNVQRVVDAYYGEMVIDDKNGLFSVSLLIYFR